MLTAIPHPEAKKKWLVVDQDGVIRADCRTFTSEIAAQAYAAHGEKTIDELLAVLARAAEDAARTEKQLSAFRSVIGRVLRTVKRDVSGGGATDSGAFVSKALACEMIKLVPGALT